MRLPFNGLYRLTQEFGVNPQNYSRFPVMYPDGIKRPMKGHNGLDFGTPHRTEVVAPHNGTIIEATFDKEGYGNYIKIENEVEGSVLAHMDQIDVKVGYQLAEGDHIGWSDSTGYSTAPHLHWGYYRFPRDRSNGIAGFIDQTPFLSNAGIHVTLDKLPTLDTPVQEAPVAPEATEKIYKGLDLSNIDSVKAAVDAWYDVAHNKYKTVEEYNNLNTQLETVKKQLEEIQKADENVSVDIKNYNALRALGYATTDDITKELNKRDNANIALQKENTQLLKRIDVLASEIQTSAKEDHTTADMAQSAIDENKELRNTIAEITKVAEAQNPKLSNIVGQILQYKDLATKFLQKAEDEYQKREEAKKPKEQAPVNNVQPVKKDGFQFLLQLFKLIPSSEEVKHIEK